jgi:hypothetical protein
MRAMVGCFLPPPWTWCGRGPPPAAAAVPPWDLFCHPGLEFCLFVFFVTHAANYAFLGRRVIRQSHHQECATAVTDFDRDEKTIA